jgi:hypothetical protein
VGPLADRQSLCSQAPVARSPVVCQAAAAEVVDVEAESSGAKGGVAHLRFKRGSAFKVGVWLLPQTAAVVAIARTGYVRRGFLVIVASCHV